MGNEEGNTDRIGNWFQTYTGKEFYIRDPRVEEVDIRDIAHALSLQCRYNGHCLKFYSVAQHSVLASHNCDPKYALWGLLHDAAEAYLGDMARPIKVDLELYNTTEASLMAVIGEAFGLDPKTQPKEVTEIDNILLATEKRDLCSPAPRSWGYIDGLTPLKDNIVPWTPEEAKLSFLRRFMELTGF